MGVGRILVETTERNKTNSCVEMMKGGSGKRFSSFAKWEASFFFLQLGWGHGSGHCWSGLDFSLPETF